MEAILADVKFGDWKFHVEEKTVLVGVARFTSVYYLQVRFLEPDLVTDRDEMQHGRKWILSKHMTKSEIVTTAFKAVLTAMEHEVREKFRYKGRMIFGPHFDVDALHEIATRRNMELREDPTSIARD
jgi:hypothetical protein